MCFVYFFTLLLLWSYSYDKLRSCKNQFSEQVQVLEKEIDKTSAVVRGIEETFVSVSLWWLISRYNYDNNLFSYLSVCRREPSFQKNHGWADERFFFSISQLWWPLTYLVRTFLWKLEWFGKTIQDPQEPKTGGKQEVSR